MALVVADASGAARLANRPWSELTGQGDAEWRGLGWLDAVVLPDRARALPALRRAADQGTVYVDDWQLAGVDGEERRVRITAQPETGPDGSTALFVLVVDVSDGLVPAIDDAGDVDGSVVSSAQLLAEVERSIEAHRRDQSRAAAVLYVALTDGAQIVGSGSIALQIASAVRPDDTIARIGADFVVLCRGVAAPEGVSRIGDRIRRKVGEHESGPGGAIRVGAAPADVSSSAAGVVAAARAAARAS